MRSGPEADFSDKAFRDKGALKKGDKKKGKGDRSLRIFHSIH
jgi:hypothetical protein